MKLKGRDGRGKGREGRGKEGGREGREGADCGFIDLVNGKADRRTGPHQPLLLTTHTQKEGKKIMAKKCCVEQQKCQEEMKLNEKKKK